MLFFREGWKVKRKKECGWKRGSERGDGERNGEGGRKGGME